MFRMVSLKGSHRSHGFTQILLLQATGILILPLSKNSEGVKDP